METQSAAGMDSNRIVVGCIVVAIALYAGAAWMGWPQQGTRMLLADEPSVEESHAPLATDGEEATSLAPAPWMVLPFVALLGAIALLPLLSISEHWWESNLHRFYIAGGLALATLAYYLGWHAHPVERHFLGHALVAPAGQGWNWDLTGAVLANAILQDFVPFIVLLFSLYTISGGIRIEGDLRAHPSTNTAFLAAGAVLASLIGTTGAAMLLIRPLLETNSERKHVRHTVVFFIFIVCNCGGCLLPIGDPPLFLGYLQGVDFLWTLSLWPSWLVVNGLLLAVYYFWDREFAFPRESLADRLRDETQVRRLRIAGTWPNALLLVAVVVCVALLDPGKSVPLTAWLPWLYLREATLLALVAISLAAGAPQVRAANRFTYSAIIEVAVLFLGIFVCMQPALQVLRERGPALGIDTPQEFFWTTGSLSSVLDNAPTYLVFFEAARALDAPGLRTMPHVGIPDKLLAAISLGAVFMGSMTYIGNGPNFMVKTIAEQAGIRMPSFFGYIAYSALLIPLFLLVTFVLL